MMEFNSEVRQQIAAEFSFNSLVENSAALSGSKRTVSWLNLLKPINRSMHLWRKNNLRGSKRTSLIITISITNSLRLFWIQA
jgi:hypothetical protein